MPKVVRVALGENNPPPIGAVDLGVNLIKAHLFERPADGVLYVAVLESQDPPKRVQASNDTGKRWIPYAKHGPGGLPEAKADFIKRASEADKNFDFAIWSSAHEPELRRELPENFKGAGW